MEREQELPKTAHDLAADWSWTGDHVGFRVAGGRVVWEDAEYTPRSDRVKIRRIIQSRLDGSKLEQVTRYVEPETAITLVPVEGAK